MTAAGLLFLLLLVPDPAVIDSVFARQARVAQELAGVEYLADFAYVETDLRTGTANSINCRRKVRMGRYEDQTYEFLAASLDGREVFGSEKERVCRDLVRKGLVARKTLLPFFLESRPEYRYSVLGRFRWQGHDVWAVGFEPRRPTDRHIRGFGYVLTTTYDVIHLEFIPAKLPFVVTEARLALDYAPVQGWWLPERFVLDMDLRLAIVVEVMRRHIHINDRYRDYRLLPGE
uniref:DUF3108 domain-containing protein n=1 Tax=candidate division WOR-3 bacterium TaxID=2052148 RepID=A0A7C4GH12_UNCW3